MAFEQIIVDYAEPLIRLEKLIKQMHDACLDKHYEEARKKCAEVISEARVLQATLAIMSEKDNGDPAKQARNG